jgi:hypothetical protein
MSDRPSRTKAIIEEELACCISALLGIPHEHQKLMTASQIRALVQFDHVIHHAIGGKVVHHNLTMRTIRDHREKTAKIDIPQIAKTKRLTAKQEEFRKRLERKTNPTSDQENTPPSRFRSRPLAGTRQSGLKRRMDGSVVKRTTSRP